MTIPTTLLGGKAYVIDLEARLFRETMDPGRYVDFDSAKGSELREQAGIVTCLGCGTSVIIPASLRGTQLRCVRCGMTLEHPHPTLLLATMISRSYKALQPLLAPTKLIDRIVSELFTATVAANSQVESARSLLNPERVQLGVLQLELNLQMILARSVELFP